MTGAAHLRLERGSLHLPGEVYDRFLHGLEAVALLRRGDDLVILPVRHLAGGGYILKRRNAAGDRVVNAADFFRAHGIDDGVERRLVAEWRDEIAGLLADGVF